MIANARTRKKARKLKFDKIHIWTIENFAENM